MTLLTRLIAPLEGEEKIPVHQFLAALAELVRGAPGVTTPALASAFNLSPTEQTSLLDFVTEMQAANIALQRQKIHDVLLLGEGGQYTVNQVMVRLGLK